ncbi:MAG TPA: hypothetical protein VLT89_10495 [Usitatibacter sp.]|nr:hypothetical protein [Usitatibacter sp.]
MQTLRRWIARLACLALAASAALPSIAQSPPGAVALRAKHAELRATLERNEFGRPIHLTSSQDGNNMRGEVYAVVDYPFSQVAGLQSAATWCDVLILPFNTKHCYATGRGADTHLKLRIGRKADQPAEQAFALDFDYRPIASTPDYLRVQLAAPAGPLGTRDYRIVLEATSLDDRRSFVHLAYAYGFTTMSKVLMQAYLSTTGAKKVGFTVTGRDAQGQPVYIGGMLGATERNTMRYFLAIDAYLASLAAPPGERVARRIEAWFTASERYPRQLHEMERGEYMALKRRETARVNAAL